MVARIDEARSLGNTVGGVFEVVAHGLPIGLGSHVHWDRRLDGALAAAVMSIPSVKGVELGLGFAQTRLLGSEVHDIVDGRDADGAWIHRSNNAGGLTGGITNGQPLVVRGAVKPISTLARPLPSADLVTGAAVEKAHYERSDISVVPAAGVVGEAMVLLVLTAAVLEKLGGDSLAEVQDNLARYLERIGRRPGPGSGDPPNTPRRRRAAKLEPPIPAGTDRAERWTWSWSGCRDAARVPLDAAWRVATGRAFVDLDDEIERDAGRAISGIFSEEGEAGFRARERRAIDALGPPDPRRGLTRVIATGGGAPVDPRNRWRLYRGRMAAWLDAPPEILAQRVRHSPVARPLLTGRDSVATMRSLAAARAPFYEPALRVNAIVGLAGIVETIERHLDDAVPEATLLLRTATPWAPTSWETAPPPPVSSRRSAAWKRAAPSWSPSHARGRSPAPRWRKRWPLPGSPPSWSCSPAARLPSGWE